MALGNGDMRDGLTPTRTYYLSFDWSGLVDGHGLVSMRLSLTSYDGGLMRRLAAAVQEQAALYESEGSPVIGSPPSIDHVRLEERVTGSTFLSENGLPQEYAKAAGSRFEHGESGG